MYQKMIPIRGMHCHSCELLLEEVIGHIQGVTKVKVNFRKGCATIEHGADIPSQNEIIHAVKQAGYEVGEPKKLLWITKNATDWQYIIFGIILLAVFFYTLRGTGILDFSLDEKNVTTGFALLLGLIAGVSTCMALVGGLILGVAARHAELHPEATAWEKFRPHLFFNSGRVLGYTLLGGLLGLLGGFLQISGNILTFLTLIVGAVMIVLGIKLTNLSPRISAMSITLPSSIARFFGLSEHQKEYSHTASMLTGALTFFLPCGFTQAMQLYAISTGNFQSGAIIMGAFALGTVPALLGIGGLSSIMKGTMARIFYAVVGILVIAFGIYNIQSAMAVFPIVSQNEEINYTPVDQEIQQQDVQVIKMTQSASGYSPKTLRVKAGVPVRWIITSESSFTCASSIVVPSLGIRTNLQKGENVIEFTPIEKGSIPYSCSMGMYRGTILVE
ncbi:MAG: Heavy metal transport/detoxification protein [Candidatus Uhrbacteria bacterium GW2011_GWF2_41_16]|uniref:Heavy metal transport/detoxification protein n=1 Tax=Candidatus Uhrbacteria bacterium GW2011_GWF2_41_16 TaxID=1618997 RepID=A0A0G0YCT7_9BACT|nr:MAG: Heavy metal transport/detoxification protein [Candidatus Uhrbacteria bacterium GW2011_GWF2_41_16]